MSESVLLYEPTIEDDGRYLTCRAENAAMRNVAIEDQFKIQVQCKCKPKILSTESLNSPPFV